MAPDIIEALVITEQQQQQQQQNNKLHNKNPLKPITNNVNEMNENRDGIIKRINHINDSHNKNTDNIFENLESNNDLCKIGNNNTNANEKCNGNSSIENKNDTVTNSKIEFKANIRWPDLCVQTFLHIGALYGFYLLFSIKLYTFIWFFMLFYGSGFGITAGAHRLWSHKAYRATWHLRLILIFLFTIAGQRDAYTWAHDHRIHHKYSETDADPHDARRGFFFAHIGWLFLTPHPQVVAKRKIIDMSDLEMDRIVMFQRKYFIPLFALISIGMPVIVPWYFWNESLWLSFWVNFNLRFTIILNIAFFVNSAAHMYGKRPYDKGISPVENLPVAIAALGEGWHNYHHVFPWDYKTGELGDYTFNITTAFIDTFAKLGWAFDRKYVSADMIARRAAKCGDGSHYLDSEESHRNPVWGVGDTDIAKEDLDDLADMHD